MNVTSFATVVKDTQPATPPQPVRTAEVAVIVPTLNERENVAILVDRLRTAMGDIAWEVVFVDDNSTDGTAGAVLELARQDYRVRAVRRIGRRGLSTACMEGILATSAPYIVVMDGDLQHDESILPAMLAALKDGAAELVVASRYVGAGGTGNWDAGRARLSRIATRMAATLNTNELTDPMSGFFALRREVFEEAVPQLSGHGFKLLLDICASIGRPLRVKEVPYVFKAREHGESKLDALVAWEFLMLLADKMFGRVVPVRFLMFAMVGGFGVVVHMAALAVAVTLGHLEFGLAQTIATVTAMTSNFFLNNTLTYRDKRLKGLAVIGGLLRFYAVCSIGALANVGVASVLFGSSYSWWLAGLAGVIVASVWNYAASSFLTWRR